MRSPGNEQSGTPTVQMIVLDRRTSKELGYAWHCYPIRETLARRWRATLHIASPTIGSTSGVDSAFPRLNKCVPPMWVARIIRSNQVRVPCDFATLIPYQIPRAPSSLTLLSQDSRNASVDMRIGPIAVIRTRPTPINCMVKFFIAR